MSDHTHKATGRELAGQSMLAMAEVSQSHTAYRAVDCRASCVQLSTAGFSARSACHANRYQVLFCD